MIPGIVSSFRRLAPPASGYAAAVLADNPLIYLRMAELSGPPVNSGSVATTGGTYGASTRGQPSLCGDAGDLSVSMSGSYGQQVKTDLPLGTVKASDFTMEAIIKPASLSGTRGLIFTGTSEAAYLRLNAGKLNLLRSQAEDMGSGATTLSVDNRYHVAVTVASDGASLLYLNGELDGALTPYSGYPVASSEIYFGSEGDLYDFYQGGFDEGAYYGTALSAARIKAHAVAAGFP